MKSDFLENSANQRYFNMNQVYNLNIETFRNINSVKPVPPTCASNFYFFKKLLCFDSWEISEAYILIRVI